MAKKRTSKKTGKKSRNRKQRSFPINASVHIVKDSSLHIEYELDEDSESWFDDQWERSRAGSRASRGFHFQDAVGAWLASSIASGNLASYSLIPEGLDDLQLEGPEPIQVEVKSRQGRLGPFSIGLAAKVIVDSWLKHVERFGCDKRLTVVFEQGIEGCYKSLTGPIKEIPMGCLSKQISGLETSLGRRITSLERLPSMLDDLYLGTTIVMCSWDKLTSETEENVKSVRDLPAAALRVLARVLQSMVAKAVDENAEVEFKNRVVLDRTSILAKLSSTAELIDLESIDYAVVQGICSVVDKQPLLIGDSYYEGVSTQPGHVGAGLVVPRASLISQVSAGLEKSQVVLLIGPSGVGKSAALWTLPFARPDVLWFRMHRASESDVPCVVRLVKAYGATPTTPVGLLVDAADSSDLEGWNRLHWAVAEIPGAFLVGTARIEDLFPLGDLSNCTTVSVSLDEEAAETIHSGLTRRQATCVPHWREAFEQSNGLTLEFTHLLTRGDRLEIVLADQIAIRVRENRSLELRILSLVSTADQWSVSIPFAQLASALGSEFLELREALERLVNEHLLVECDGVVRGIHKTRSGGIVRQIHKTPPPLLESTVKSVLRLLHGPALSRFLFEALREVPTIEEPILRELEVMVGNSAERLVACLQGLELLDRYRQASIWIDIAESNNVPPAHYPRVLLVAISGGQLSELFDARLRNAILDIAALPEQSSLRGGLLCSVGIDTIVSELAAVSSARDCLHLLGPLCRTSIDWKQLLVSLHSDSPFVSYLRTCAITEFGDCVSAAREVSPELARAFVDSVGGTEAVLNRIRASDPWIWDLRVCSSGSALVGVSRFLYVSESQQHDVDYRAVTIGDLLLRALPDLGRVDVKAAFSSELACSSESVLVGSSGLLREYQHSATRAAGNRETFRLAHNIFGKSETERLAVASDLLTEAAELVRDFGNVFVRSSMRPSLAKQLSERQNNLLDRGERLSPKLSSNLAADSKSIEVFDPLSGIILSVCNNILRRIFDPDEYRKLVVFIKETVLAKDIPEVRDQPWRLLGFEDAPPALDELAKVLSDIVAVITELSEDTDSKSGIMNCARKGNAERSLVRAADWTRQRNFKREWKRRKDLVDAFQSSGLTVDVRWIDEELLASQSSNFAVIIDIQSVAEWSLAVDELVPTIEGFRNLNEEPLLVPVLEGRSIPTLSLKLVSKLWPADDLGDFEHLLPPPLEQRLTTYFSAAHSSLVVISSLSILRMPGDLHEEVNQVLERSIIEYQEAISLIRDIGSDACVTSLIELLEEVKSQIDDEWSGRVKSAKYVEGIVKGTQGIETPEVATFTGALLLSLQWDSDPEIALAWYVSL